MIEGLIAYLAVGIVLGLMTDAVEARRVRRKEPHVHLHTGHRLIILFLWPWILHRWLRSGRRG